MELKDVEKLSSLARVAISEEEKSILLKDMEAILGYIDQIQEVITEKITPETKELRNVLRKDVDPHKSGEFSEEILNEAPSIKDGYLKVKKIL